MTVQANPAQSDFAPCPAGTHLAVCVDVVDLGLVESDFQGQHRIVPKVRVVFETADRDAESNRPYRLIARLTNSLHEKASLRKFLESWIARPLSSEELKNGFDLEQLLLGRSAIVSVTHNITPDRTYANIAGIGPIMAGMAPLTPSGDYVRITNRPLDGSDGANGHGAPSAQGPIAANAADPSSARKGFFVELGNAIKAKLYEPSIKANSEAGRFERRKLLRQLLGGDPDPEKMGFAEWEQATATLLIVIARNQPPPAGVDPDADIPF